MAERAANQLELNKSQLPNSITDVIATLTRAGFDAYIVGGGVRDTLLGLDPKDFDAVTDAKPHEIKDVFGKRCRIIGRRFQLAHVYSGRELIEVATFRGPPTSTANTNQDGMILRDNVWGDIKQDFVRRDFSINALYYQPIKGVVHDFCGALEDIENRIIRLLGDAPVRIEEDPVRLLRALRFKAKLGFEFDAALAAQFHDSNWALLEQISPHRLYDETQKMFTGGYLVPLLPLLFEYGAIDSLIIYPPSQPSPLVKQVAINTDKRIAAGKSINPAFFYAALLWENYLHQLEKAKNRNMPFADAQLHAAGKVIERQRIKTAIPKFAEQFIRDIWLLQPKLAAPRTKQIVPLSEHPRFRAGFDFLLLREQCGDAQHPLSESTNGMGEWWQTYQTLSEADQQQAIAEFDETIRRGAYKQSKRGRQRQKHADHTASDTISTNDATSPTSSNHPAKSPMNDTAHEANQVPERRRRRTRHQDSSVSASATFPQNVATKSTAASKKPAVSKQQARHDHKEWMLLQQLSLANAADSSDDQPQRKPLFVIEQDNVVPPLQKQVDTTANGPQKDDRQKPSTSRQAPSNPETKQGLTRAVSNAEAKSQSLGQQRVQQSDEPTAAHDDAKASRKARHNKNSHSMTPAQAPHLVTANEAPIPSKRRRRAPSTATVSAQDTSQATPTSPATKQSPTKQSATKQSATTHTDNCAAIAQTQQQNRQAPIPAKRRRRKPSAAST